MTCVRGVEPAWLSWFPVRERILQGSRPGELILVDVGGGRGHDVSAFKRKWEGEFSQGARVMLRDLPAVLEDAEKLEEGIEKKAHDFFTPQTVLGEFVASPRTTVPATRPLLIKIKVHVFIITLISSMTGQTKPASASYEVQRLLWNQAIRRFSCMNLSFRTSGAPCCNPVLIFR